MGREHANAILSGSSSTQTRKNSKSSVYGMQIILLFFLNVVLCFNYYFSQCPSHNFLHTTHIFHYYHLMPYYTRRHTFAFFIIKRDIVGHRLHG